MAHQELIDLPIDVPRFPNIEPLRGSFLKASTDDEMVKINKTTNVMERIDLIDSIFIIFILVFLFKF